MNTFQYIKNFYKPDMMKEAYDCFITGILSLMICLHNLFTSQYSYTPKGTDYHVAQNSPAVESESKMQLLTLYMHRGS